MRVRSLIALSFFALFGNYLRVTKGYSEWLWSVLRRTRPDLPRPYRMWGYPVTPLIFLAITV